MARVTLYNIVGRYINSEDAREVVGYHLKSADGLKSTMCSMEQIAFLTGKGQILNVQSTFIQ